MSKKYMATIRSKNDPRLFDVLCRPIVTEKATNLTQFNCYSFVVGKAFNKLDVKAAVEAIYNVSVMQVNVLNAKGKAKRFKGRPGKRSDIKKAFVKLVQGQTIDLGLGV